MLILCQYDIFYGHNVVSSSVWFLQLTVFKYLVVSHVTEPGALLTEPCTLIKSSHFSIHPGTCMLWLKLNHVSKRGHWLYVKPLLLRVTGAIYYKNCFWNHGISIYAWKQWLIWVTGTMYYNDSPSDIVTSQSVCETVASSHYRQRVLQILLRSRCPNLCVKQSNGTVNWVWYFPRVALSLEQLKPSMTKLVRLSSPWRKWILETMLN